MLCEQKRYQRRIRSALRRIICIGVSPYGCIIFHQPHNPEGEGLGRFLTGNSHFQRQHIANGIGLIADMLINASFQNDFILRLRPASLRQPDMAQRSGGFVHGSNA